MTNLIEIPKAIKNMTDCELEAERIKLLENDIITKYNTDRYFQLVNEIVLRMFKIEG